MQEVMVNGRWPLIVANDSAVTPGWSWWERETLAVLHAVIRPGDVVWEIGAEKGYLAALYATWGAGVICVEPDPTNVDILKAILTANGVTPSWFRYTVGAEYALPDVVSLDWMLNETADPTVVSIDIEGAEYQALLGAENLLTDVRPIIHVAIHPEAIRSVYGDTPDDVLCHLEKHRYELHHIDYDHEHHWLAKPRP